MCEPTTLLAAGTALSAGGGVMSAISGHQSGMASYRAQRAQTKLNNQRMMQEWAYRNAQRDREWQQTLKIYDLKVKQHKAQVVEYNDALYRAYTDGRQQRAPESLGTGSSVRGAFRPGFCVGRVAGGCTAEFVPQP